MNTIENENIEKHIKNLLNIKDIFFVFDKNCPQMWNGNIEINDLIILIKEYFDEYIEKIKDGNMNDITLYFIHNLNFVLQYHKFNPLFNEFKVVGKMADIQKIAMAHMIYYSAYTNIVYNNILNPLGIEEENICYSIKNVTKVLNVLIEYKLKPNKYINHYAFMCFKEDNVVIDKKYAQYFIDNVCTDVCYQLDVKMFNNVYLKFYKVIDIINIDLFNCAIKIKSIELIEYLLNNKLEITNEIFNYVLSSTSDLSEFKMNVMKMMIISGYALSKIERYKLKKHIPEIEKWLINEGIFTDDINIYSMTVQNQLNYFDTLLRNINVKKFNTIKKIGKIVVKKIEYDEFEIDTLIEIIKNFEKYNTIDNIITKYIENIPNLLNLEIIEKLLTYSWNKIKICNSKCPLSIVKLINEKINYTYNPSLNYNSLIMHASSDNFFKQTNMLENILNSYEFDIEMILKSMYNSDDKYYDYKYNLLLKYINEYNINPENILEHLYTEGLCNDKLINKLFVELNLPMTREIFIETINTTQLYAIKTVDKYIMENNHELEDIVLELLKVRNFLDAGYVAKKLNGKLGNITNVLKYFKESDLLIFFDKIN
jgi:hypothetical protein